MNSVNIQILLYIFDKKNIMYVPKSIDITKYITSFSITNNINSIGETLSLRTNAIELKDILEFAKIEIYIQKKLTFLGYVKQINYQIEKGMQSLNVSAVTFAELLNRDELTASPFFTADSKFSKIKVGEGITVFTASPDEIIKKIFQVYFIEKSRYAYKSGVLLSNEDIYFYDKKLFVLNTENSMKYDKKDKKVIKLENGTVWSEMQNMADKPFNFLFTQVKNNQINIILHENPIPYSNNLKYIQSVQEFTNRTKWNELPQKNLIFDNIISLNLSKNEDIKTFFYVRPVIYNTYNDNVGFAGIIFPLIKESLTEKLVNIFGYRKMENNAQFLNLTKEKEKEKINKTIKQRVRKLKSWYGSVVQFESGSITIGYDFIDLLTKIYISELNTTYLVTGYEINYTYGETITNTINVEWGAKW